MANDMEPAIAAGVSPDDSPAPVREVRYEVSRDFAAILQELQISLLASTYQAGKLVVLGTNQNGLALSFHNFEQAMGVAVHSQQIAVGSRSQIWFLRSAPALASRLDGGPYDACYLARAAHVTDELHGHEMAWSGDVLWFVNTRFSCLCTLHDDYSFVPRWWPPFVSALAAEDRCHLNGLAMQDGQPKYVTVMAQSDSAAGWRPTKATSGCLLDVPSGQAVAQGFAMPHSPRIYNDRVWVLDSGRGQLVVVDPQTGRFQPISQQPGYTRGLAFYGPYAFVGLSKIRETSTFGGVPIAEQREQLKCAIVIIDLRTGQRKAYFEFLSGVEEIFDVQVLPGIRHPFLAGPMAAAEGSKSVWYAPRPDKMPLQALAASATDSAPITTSRVAVPATITVPDEALRQYKQGNALSDQDRFEDATACFREAVRLSPEFAEAHCNLGVVLQFQRKLAESVGCFLRALELRPDLPAAHFNLAMTNFLREDFEHAWPGYEWRWKCSAFGNRPAAAIRLAPTWDGSSLEERTILVYGEQGIGDEIMFASCMPDLMEQAARCIVACETRLAPIFSRSFPNVEIVPIHQLENPTRVAELGSLDFQIATGSVPGFVRHSRENFPQRQAFLFADPEKVRRWRDRLAELGMGLKVGISWRGGKEANEVRRRSTSLDQWSPLASVPGVHFVNLQYGQRTNDLEQVRRQDGMVIHDWSDVDPLHDLDDFAAQIAALDLVISIDNSTVHLAGSLGVETWMLTSFPSASYWRWPLNRDETLWYPSVRVFRKFCPAAWNEVIRQVHDQLRDKVVSY